eukprot:scaffold18830_cov77-Isochrysis_galbana.AAC.1
MHCCAHAGTAKTHPPASERRRPFPPPVFPAEGGGKPRPAPHATPSPQLAPPPAHGGVGRGHPPRPPAPVAAEFRPPLPLACNVIPPPPTPMPTPAPPPEASPPPRPDAARPSARVIRHVRLPHAQIVELARVGRDIPAVEVTHYRRSRRARRPLSKGPA